MEASNIVKCSTCGNMYDTRRSGACPSCSQVVMDAGPGCNSDKDVTVIQKAVFTDTADETVSVNAVSADSPNDVTIGVNLSDSGNKRGDISGWLVCVDGPDKGKDYRLRFNNNFIGRDISMDVFIASDTAVHKQKHMTVVYEPNDKKFFAAPMGGAVCYLNGETLSRSTEIHDFDRIRLGGTELVFRSLCGEEFVW